jgi:ParB family chromosome partitioning protein
MEFLGKIKDPVHGYEQEIIVALINELRVIEIQRKPSESHIKRLMESIRKIGFVVPVICVKRGEELIIIDGQHRFLAARRMGLERIPCILIPEKYANELMELNIEKTMSLKEKCYVALNVYRIFLDEEPELMENDTEIMDAIEYPYFITIGLAYEKYPKFFGSAYESIMKKVDVFLDSKLPEAYKIREKYANELLELDSITREVMKKVEELGITHPFLYKEIVSFCNPIKRKKIVEEPLEEVISKLRENLLALNENPERFRVEGFQEK